MVDAGPKRVNKGGAEPVWYRPPLPMARPVPAFASGVSGDVASGRFSTTVENSVEISGLSGLTAMKSLVLSESAYGEGNLMAVLSMLFGL
jgi:hypothetical protein